MVVVEGDDPAQVDGDQALHEVESHVPIVRFQDFFGIAGAIIAEFQAYPLRRSPGAGRFGLNADGNPGDAALTNPVFDGVGGEEAAAKAIEDAVGQVLDQGLRTADIMSEGMTKVGTDAMGEAVVAVLG